MVKFSLFTLTLLTWSKFAVEGCSNAGTSQFYTEEEELMVDFAKHLGTKRISILVDDADCFNDNFGKQMFNHEVYVSIIEVFQTNLTQWMLSRIMNEQLTLLILLPQSSEIIRLIDHLIEKTSKEMVWLLRNTSFSRDIQKMQHTSLDSNVFTYSANFDDHGYLTIDIFEIYHVQSDMPNRILHYGLWDPHHHLRTTFQKKYERRRDLTGLTLRTTVETWEPLITVTEDKHGNIEIHGLMADLFFGLQEITNFSYTFMRPVDGAWGYELPDGNWTGMIGQVFRNEADISPSGFFVIEDRKKAIDFLRPVLVADGRIFFRNPNHNYNWFAYLTPLWWQVWLLIILMMLFMPLIISLLAYLPPRDKHLSEFTVAKSYIFVFGALTFIRRWSVTPESTSTRVLFFLITLAGLLFQCHWKAGIISQLTVVNIPTPFQDLKGVLRSDYKFMIFPGGNLVTEFSTSSDPVLSSLWERDLKDTINKTPTSYDELVAQALSDDYAFLDYFESPVSMSEEYVSCKLVSTKKPLMPSLNSFIARKNASFTSVLDYFIGFLKEKGHFKKMEAYYRVPNQYCGGGTGTPIGLNNIISACMLFLMGVTVSWLLFGVENVSNSLRTRKVARGTKTSTTLKEEDKRQQLLCDKWKIRRANSEPKMLNILFFQKETN